nr:SpoIID/LytB domain-containing protein [uncultured Faecalimonas sp.]
MRRKARELFSLLVIIFLLPYVVTLFMNGAHIKTSSRIEEDYVKVQSGTRIEEIVWEEYLAGVLAKEMRADSELEALKAQAVILRSGFYEKLDHDRKTIFTDDFYRMEELEKEWGEDAAVYEENLKKAVRETDNMILQYQDQYVTLPYHKLSAGKTRTGQDAFGSEDYPYLQARDCPKDLESARQLKECVYSFEKVKEQCRKFLTAVENPEETDKEKKTVFEDFEIQGTDGAGYVTTVRIGQAACTGEEFRQALDLPSSHFSFQEQEGKLKVTSGGIGHGVGMSQYTAEQMAKEGKGYEEILQYFYEGIQLKDGGEIFLKLE